MKLFLIASMVLGGSGAVAMTNEEVREDVRGFVEERVNERMQARHEERLETLREEGLQYPEGEEFLALTEEQQAAIIELIDEYNATYDFSTLTDEEIKDVLQAFKADLELLAEELGFELPERPTKEEIRGRIRENVKDHMREKFEERKAAFIEDIRENGFELKHQEKLFENLTEEQQIAVTEKVEEINATYDFSAMTDEEILDAMQEIKEDLKLFFEENGIELPPKPEGYNEGFRKGFKHGYRHGYKNGSESQEESNPPLDEDTL